VNTENHSPSAAFLWSIADLLRGDFKQSQYGRIILPLTCVHGPIGQALGGRKP
jgi:type I restriction enzyme M protein